MNLRLFIFLIICLSTIGIAQAQPPLPSQRDTIPSVPDSLAVPTDTNRVEGRRERRARERSEREAAEERIKLDPVRDSLQIALIGQTKKVWVRSLIIPGWGQVTNGGLWWIKVPVIYGGFVSAGLIFEFNQRYYRIFLSEAQYRTMNNNTPLNPDYVNANTQAIINAKDFYRRNRDLTVLLTVGWYAINAIEAYTDYMLRNRWNIGEDLSFKVSPTLLQTPAMGAYAYNPLGVGIKFTFDIR